MNLPVFNKDMAAEDLELLMMQARKASDLLKALSHEVRLVILCLLSEGEKSVSELEEILTMPQAAVSQQLARLRLEGLVQSRRDGRMIYYSLVDDEVSSIIGSLYDLFCRDARAGGK
ncbi:metalloregulator ArsR/SmtB family transcription factor [Labrenzia sp. OB1]|uniref:ArsR/SmtB family transcription factor n=1 Tax=Labrenzia sp. OB1 TaxID=1561204 RepID=UPI0007B2EF49|nr:metalloregulator ArsR/SmtB family transcription factor [Labrenzia sp. OB1]KZM48724.1 transcriptional regulator [Labrenzia sp. OB1]